MTGHHLPAVRARHEKYLLARLPRDDGLLQFSTTVFTTAETIPLIGTTLVETQTITVVNPVFTQSSDTQTSTTSTQATSTPTQASSTVSSDTTSSSSAASTSSPTSSSSSTSASSASDTSSSAATSAPSDSATNSVNPTSAASVSDTLSNASAKSTQAASFSHNSSASAASTSQTAALDAANAATSSSKGLSGGAIGGIVVAVIAVTAVIVIYAVRKIFLRRRQNRRISWGDTYPKAGPIEPYNEKAMLDPPPIPDKPRAPLAPVAVTIPAPPTAYNSLPPPPMSMPAAPAPAMGAVPPMLTTTAALQPAVALAPASASAAHAYVRCTFIPHLPDELSITTGELVRVLNEYDDGWALCQNVRGEQGVVPLECLDRGHSAVGPQAAYMGQGTGDWRMSRRASSLNTSVRY